MDLSNYFPEKRQVRFGRHNTRDTLSHAPKRNRNRNVWLSSVGSIDLAYVIFSLDSLVKLFRFALVGKVRGEINFSIGYFHHFHPTSIDYRRLSEAVIVFHQQSYE